MSEILTYPAFLLFGTGIISGVISSIPLGPTNLWLAQSVLPPQKNKSEQYHFIAAITLMDVSYALMALWGYYLFLQGTALSFFLILVSATALIGLGLIDLRKLCVRDKKCSLGSVSVESEVRSIQRSSSRTSSFFLGLVLGSNPGFLVYWLMVARMIETMGVEVISLSLGFLFAIGLILADIGWYLLVLKLSRLSVSFLSGSVLRLTRVVLAFSFILFGLGMLWDISSFAESVL